jgi:probable HAF family extracellular repeat protein
MKTHLQLEPLESRLLLTRYNLVILGSGFLYAWGLNQNGDVVGRADTYGGDISAAEWSTTGQQTIFDVNPPSTAISINDMGQVVGVESLSQVGRYPFMCQGQHNCHDFPLLDGDTQGLAYSINQSGQAVGVSGYEHFGTTHAVLWQNGGVTDLGLGEADAINDFGFVVGRGPEGVFGWKHGQRKLLPGLTGSPQAINDHFQIVGGNWLWDHGNIITLPFNPVAINNNGDIVGWDINAPQIWENGVTENLRDLVIDTMGWTLQTARGINDAGQICGFAILPGGGVSAYRLDPVGNAPSWTFTADGAVVHKIAVTGLGETTLITPGDQTITVRDTTDDTITGNAMVTVLGGNSPRMELGNFNVDFNWMGSAFGSPINQIGSVNSENLFFMVEVWNLS